MAEETKVKEKYECNCEKRLFELERHVKQTEDKLIALLEFLEESNEKFGDLLCKLTER